MTRKVGSSSESDCKALDSFSISCFVFGSTATEITGSGINKVSSTIWALSSQSVSPVKVSLSPNTAPRSPALNSSTSWRSSAFKMISREIRSFLFLLEFSA